MNRTRSAAIGLAVALFLTGASGLVYQVLWSRYLGLLLGSSAVAIVVVLAAFMGGLAIGSWVFGRLSDRPISRLTLYGWLDRSRNVRDLWIHRRRHQDRRLPGRGLPNEWNCAGVQ